MFCTLLVLILSSFHPGIYSLCFSCGIAATHRPRRYHGTPQLLQPALSEHPPFYQSYSCRSHSPPATAAQWLCAPAGPYLRTWANFQSKVPKRVGVVKALSTEAYSTWKNVPGVMGLIRPSGGGKNTYLATKCQSWKGP